MSKAHCVTSAGLTELNGSSSQPVMELLRNAMLNQSVALSVKAVSKNVHAVSVEKCSENGMINIAENLVMCGLAENLSSKRESASTKGTFLRGIHSRGHCLSSSDCLSSSLQPPPPLLLLLLCTPVAIQPDPRSGTEVLWESRLRALEQLQILPVPSSL